MSPGGRRCVFFDRDGVVNRSPGAGYVLAPEQFELNEGIVEALRVVRERGALAIVATSQKGVGKGLMSRADLDRVHRRMAGLLAVAGVGFEAVFAHTGTGDPDDFPPKPEPGMLLAAAARFGLDLRQSWMIGDSDRDIAMGLAAGLAGTIRLRAETPVGIEATYTLDSTAEIPEILRKIL